MKRAAFCCRRLTCCRRLKLLPSAHLMPLPLPPLLQVAGMPPGHALKFKKGIYKVRSQTRPLRRLAACGRPLTNARTGRLLRLPQIKQLLAIAPSRPIHIPKQASPTGDLRKRQNPPAPSSSSSSSSTSEGLRNTDAFGAFVKSHGMLQSVSSQLRAAIREEPSPPKRRSPDTKPSIPGAPSTRRARRCFFPAAAAFAPLRMGVPGSAAAA